MSVTGEVIEFRSSDTVAPVNNRLRKKSIVNTPSRALKIGAKIAVPVSLLVAGAVVEYKLDAFKPYELSTPAQETARRNAAEMKRTDRLSRTEDSRSSIGNIVLNSLGKEQKNPTTGKITKTGIPEAVWVVDGGKEIVAPCNLTPLDKTQRGKFKGSGRDGQLGPAFDLRADENFGDMVVEVKYKPYLEGAHSMQSPNEPETAEYHLNDPAHAAKFMVFASSFCPQPSHPNISNTASKPGGAPTAPPSIPKP